MQIRNMESEDIYEVFTFCKKFYRKAGYTNLGKLDQDKTVEFLRAQIDNPYSLVKVVDDDGDITGFACFSLTQNPFSSSILGYEIFFWVENKNPFTAKKLIQEYEDWAKNNGAVAVRFGSIPELTDKRFDGFLVKMGYTLKETSFIKEL